MSSEPYWTVSYGHANRTGWSCRECHSVIYQGEPIVIRDGRKLRLTYHEHCYSGGSDPRTQAGSSYHDQKWATTQPIRQKAPPCKGYGKWSCSEYGYKGDLYGTLQSVGNTQSRFKATKGNVASRSFVRETEHSNSSKKSS